MDLIFVMVFPLKDRILKILFFVWEKYVARTNENFKPVSVVRQTNYSRLV